VLVSYSFGQGLLGSVTDRAGHITRYTYASDGSIVTVALPRAGTEAVRQLQFVYTLDTTDTTGKTRTVSELIDAEGNRTTFKYAFNRDNFNKYLGGTTWMVNALGVKRTESNDAEYVQWRLDNGYYATWDTARYTLEPAYRAQADEIRLRHTTLFTYDGNGALLTVTEPRGFTARYEYDALESPTPTPTRSRAATRRTSATCAGTSATSTR
jgi:YD repeat-containing protein